MHLHVNRVDLCVEAVLAKMTKSRKCSGVKRCGIHASMLFRRKEKYKVQLLILLPKARETSIGPIRKKLSVDPATSNFEIAMGGRKIKMCKSLQIWASKLRND